jgi:hypothetical protein
MFLQVWFMETRIMLASLSASCSQTLCHAGSELFCLGGHVLVR